MAENIVELKNITKEYKVYANPQYRLLYSLTKIKKFQPKIFNAISDVSFSIKKGEILGIIGKNGAGKSTILKLITGVSFPTKGEIIKKGRIASLLELGAGFNPELTGMENIFFQGSLMGITEEKMLTKIPEILSFAAIGDFINQPVKNYSSGMFARLAFATAINVEPDILIVDEVLSVGDIAFQFKCIEKMKEFAAKGVTILFVTHAMMSLYRFCNRAIWIDGGKVVMDGTVEEVVPKYEDNLKSNSINVDGNVEISESDFVNVNKIKLLQKSTEVTQIEKNLDFTLHVEYELKQDLQEHPYFALSIVKNGMPYDVFGIYPAQERYSLAKEKGKYEIDIIFKNQFINIGEYEVYLSVSEQNGISQLFFSKIIDLVIAGEYDSLGLIDIEHDVLIKKL